MSNRDLLALESTTGFILTRQQQDGPTGIVLTYWVRTIDQVFPVTVPNQETIFFVLDEQVEEVERILMRFSGWRIVKLELTDLNYKGVHGLYCRSLKVMRQIVDLLRLSGIVMMEEDIRLTDRFLMERFIQGGVAITQCASQFKLKPAEVFPRFRILSIDLETTMRADKILSAAFYADDFRLVLMLGEGEDKAEIKYYPSEKSLLLAFIDVVERYDPDVFIGWNVVGFDFRVLKNRADALHIALRLGRDKQPIQLHESGQGKLFIRMAGRMVLDGIDTLKGATYQFESFSLENVSRQMLDRGKLIDHVEVRGDEIQRLFRDDKEALARYNLEDCKLVWDIFEKADLINYLIERARLTGLSLDKVGGSAAAFDNQYLPLLHRKGYVAPEYASGVSGLSAPGGYVMDSRPGLYSHVLVLDFKSLYPSIIRTFKVDPYGLAEGLKEDSLPEDLLPGFNHAIFSRSKTILPKLIETLWAARDQAKRAKNAALSQAIKIIMNSFYGVLGSNVCRFYDQRLSSSITLRGHEILTKTAECIEDNFGFKVIYGDTDSVFVWLGDDFSTENADKKGELLAEFLNSWWRENLQQRFQLDTQLEIEYETHYSRFLMPTIRHSEKGSKKRYAGLKRLSDGSERMVFKGLENVRTDWTPLARELQENLYERVFKGQEWKSLLKNIVEQLKQGEVDAKLVYRKRIRQRLDQYVKNKPPHVQAGLKAEREYEQLDQPSPYRSGSYIEYVITVNGPEPVEFVRSSLDYQHYLEKQIRPVAEAIMQFLGEDFDDLVAPQIKLF
ncbi:DNA polymerase II [Neptuniibacter sp. 2_MG-2023]|uniref:DNA polymerase II n=1 Tax=Neptuniibacter sp. 2_MG-2023 TaxID=3062671 RepID=UPI0026E37A5C|nr:DNA polymerase II [Neptuniibacter sp. 2_MG-2023]MDO6514270.1 DNA polymerase II [Neptuniibacter sp. 2_MG-2023]